MNVEQQQFVLRQQHIEWLNHPATKALVAELEKRRDLFNEKVIQVLSLQTPKHDVAVKYGNKVHTINQILTYARTNKYDDPSTDS
jgi:hypothetical protein